VAGSPASHPLDGPRGKLIRAGQQARMLNRHCEAYVASAPIELVARFDAATASHLVYTQGRPPPLYLKLILGEIIHDLRSALDQLAWQLAIQHTQPSELASRKAMNAIQFPISSSEDSFRTHRAMRYFGKDAAAQIDVLQPYHNVGSPLINPLAVVQELSNTDKHQVLRPSLGQIRPDDLTFRSTEPINIEEVELLLPDQSIFADVDVSILRIPAPAHAVIEFDPPLLQVRFDTYIAGQRQVLDQIRLISYVSRLAKW
jgi:hypothetical protein